MNEHSIRGRVAGIDYGTVRIGIAVSDAGRTIASKSPQQLAEVTEAARRLDGIEHVVMTTGTPPTPG